MSESRRGRPRPQETIVRDRQVVRVLRASPAPLTRAELAARLGVSHSLAYLALRRLQQGGLVRYVNLGHKRHAWEAVADPHPLPAVVLP